MAPVAPVVWIVGLGHPLRGDDAIGPRVAHAIAERAPGLEVTLCPGGALELVGAWAGRPLVVVIDAALGDGPAGTVTRIEGADELTRLAGAGGGGFRGSTHGFGLPEAVALGRSLGQLPDRLVVYAITGAEFELGAAPSPAVLAALEPVVRGVLAEVAPWWTGVP